MRGKVQSTRRNCIARCIAVTKEVFDKIFDWGIQNFITELQNNNPLIKAYDIQECKGKAYESYNDLICQYKDNIFSKSDNCLLDRHRVASCVCGAFLRTNVFNKTDLLQQIIESKKSVEAGFYYVNEWVAFHAGCRYLSYFMAYDHRDNRNVFLSIIENFPSLPQTTLVKKGFLNCILFNLSQVKDEDQIGLAHYDLYAYAMLFFNLEQNFYHSM